MERIKSIITGNLYSGWTIVKLFFKFTGVETLDFSFTTINAGFLSPALINCCNSFVCVAENNPVLLRRGKQLKILSKVAENPKSNNLSASSNTRNS